MRASFLDIKWSPRRSGRTGGSAAASPGGAGGSRGEKESPGGRSGWSSILEPEVSELGAALSILGIEGLWKPSESASGLRWNTTLQLAPRPRSAGACRLAHCRADVTTRLNTGAEAGRHHLAPGRARNNGTELL